MNANRNLLKDDELVIVMGKVQPDRFSGGLQLKVNQVWDLEPARCRFGKYLRVAVNGTAPDMQRLVRELPAAARDDGAGRAGARPGGAADVAASGAGDCGGG